MFSWSTTSFQYLLYPASLFGAWCLLSEPYGCYKTLLTLLNMTLYIKPGFYIALSLTSSMVYLFTCLHLFTYL